jgi:hypothetical protein
MKLFVQVRVGGGGQIQDNISSFYSFHVFFLLLECINVGTCQRPQITFVPFKERYTVRRMYIAAVEVDWEYAPRKLNTMTLTDLRLSSFCYFRHVYS